jgi:NAD(P)-dependent dehydrogenase (short-subunit alcohol dehydrogenase family)
MVLVAGEVILVTGATDGLGRGVAGELARRGARVLVHGRDPGRVEATSAELGDRAAGSYEADFASLGEVRAMAERVLADHERLDVVVNNAGIGSTLPGEGARLESRDGYELRFAVNYLAGFLLTGLLEPLLTGSPASRVVNVSSAGQMPIDFDDVMLERGYNGTRAYCQSKLAQVMHTFDLAERLADRGVTANCLHPATYMPTKIVLHARGTAASSLEEGVRATTRLVVDPELERTTGRYFDGLREARADAQAYDLDARRCLRELSEQLVAEAIGPLEARRA